MSGQTDTIDTKDTEIQTTNQATAVAVPPAPQKGTTGSPETILPGGKDQVSHRTVEPSPQFLKTEAIIIASTQGSGGLPPESPILDEAKHIIEATIIKPGQAKVTTCDGKPIVYTEEALKNSLPMWEAAACFCDHWNKSVRNIAGVFFAPWYDQGVKARLRFIDDTLYNMVARIVKDRDDGLAVPDVGLSADIAVNGTRSETAFTVDAITRVMSADIVFSPAAGGSFDRVLNSVKQELGIAETKGSGGSPPEPLVPIKRVRDLQGTADRLRNQVKDQEATITTLQANLTQAVARYRDATLATHPEIPADLVKGATIAEVDASLENAQAIVDQVRKHLDTDNNRTITVPAGAPVRKGPDPASMSPKDLIAYGLRQHQRGKA